MAGKKGMSKADVAKRRIRVRYWMTERATSDQIQQQLKVEGFKISAKTLDRDLAAIRADDLQSLYTQGHNQFVSDFETIKASIRNEIRHLKLTAADDNARPYDKISARRAIIEAESLLADLLAYGPTVLAVRRAMEKQTTNKADEVRQAAATN